MTDSNQPKVPAVKHAVLAQKMAAQLAQIIAPIAPALKEGEDEQSAATVQHPQPSRFAVKPPKPPYGTRRSMGKR